MNVSATDKDLWKALSKLITGGFVLEAKTVEAEPAPTPDEADTIRLPAPALARSRKVIPSLLPHFFVLLASCLICPFW